MKKVKMCSLLYLATVLCIMMIVPANAATKPLSSKERKEYGSILWNKRYVADAEGLIYNSADFILYDVNGDGRKELLVSGPLCLRNVMYTMIYGFDGSEFYKTCVRGVVIGVSNRGISILDTDYGGDTNSVYYSDTYVYTVDQKCKLSKKIYHLSYIDYLTDQGKDEYYNRSGKKLSKKSFDKTYKKYKFKTVGYKEYNDKTDIYWNSAQDQKVVLKTFGRSALPKLPDGNYTVIDSYGKISGSDYKIKAEVEKNGGKKYSANTYIFALAKNCKYGCVEDEDFYSCSKKEFMEQYMSIPHMTVRFQLNNGKVVKLYVTPF